MPRTLPGDTYDLEPLMTAKLAVSTGPATSIAASKRPCVIAARPAVPVGTRS